MISGRRPWFTNPDQSGRCHGAGAGFDYGEPRMTNAVTGPRARNSRGDETGLGFVRLIHEGVNHEPHKDNAY